jgi:predicted O-methyltransferase YrrM
MTRASIGLDERLNEYLVLSGTREHPVAAKLRAATAAMPNASMQIAVEQGQLLAMLVRLVNAKNAIEVGTFCGYSALWVAMALPADGKLIACDVSAEWTAIARRYWQEAGIADKIELRLAPASETLAALESAGGRATYDFAFVDADKSGYDDYYERMLRLLRPGGVIVFDNVLWSGRVVDAGARDADTKAIRALNAKIATDTRVDKVMLPIGDGMTVVRKI